MADFRAYQPAFTSGELSPALWARVDLAKYNSGMKIGKNVFVHPHGGVSNRAGTEFIGEVKDSNSFTRLIPFQFNTTQSYILEFGNTYGRVYKNGGRVLSGGVGYEFVTPYTTTFLRDLVTTQEADIMYLTSVDYAPRKLGRLADNNWQLTTPQFEPAISFPTGVFATRLVGNSATTTHTYKVSAIDAITGEESLPSAPAGITNDLTIAGNKNRVAWSAMPGADRYVVYKLDNGQYGYLGATGGITFEDDNITPDLADGPQVAYNPFVGAGNYPRCSTFSDQRLLLASTKNNPQTVWGSQTGNYENFSSARPAKASDGLSFRIRSRQVNEIRSMIPSKLLMILTSGSENTVSGGSEEYITPQNIVVKPQSYRGCSKIQPIVVGSQVLFAQDRGGVIRDFSYEFAEDSYTGKDLTIMARHLFKDRDIVAWAYAQAPSSIVWVVLDNGQLISLTYMKEHDVWAWTRHETDGLFEDVAVIGEGKEDVPYFIVRRVVNGQVKRYIERLHTRSFSDVKDAFFVDCGLTYIGAPATVLTGLGHLEGKTVVALADGNVVRDLVVVGGSVTLPNPASKVHVGLPYEATIKTLDLDIGQVNGLGTIQGRYKSFSEVTFRVEETRGIWLGSVDDTRESGKLVEFKQRAGENWGEAIRLLTGDFTMTAMADWSTGANIVVKQFDPLPMTILAIMPDITLGK